jgi:carbohydrate binding domain
MTEGTEPSLLDSVFVPRDKLIFDEDFEGGYGVLNGIDGNFAPQGKLAYVESDVIDGKYSVCAESSNNITVWLCGSGNKVKLATNEVYTLLFRVKSSGNARLCVAVVSDKHGQKSTLANFDKQGKMYSDLSYNVASYVTVPSDDYREIRIIFTTPSEGNLQLRFGAQDGKISVDNVRLYKNAADVSFDDKAKFIGGG